MRLTDNIMGAALMTGCVLAYVVNDAVMKLLFVEMALFQAVFLRGLMTISLLCLMVWRSKVAIRGLSRQNQRLVALRVGAEICATIAFLTALKHMPLANVTAILQALPLAVTMAAALFLAEPVGWRRWSAIIIGFTGVLIVIRPGLVGFNIYSLLAIAGAASAAAVMVIIRKISQFEQPVTILSYQSILVGLIMIPPTLVYWVQPSLYEWLVMAAIGVLSVFGQLANIQGFKEGNASAVAPMDYTRLVFAAMIGFLLFGEIPEWTLAIGAGLVIATSLYRFQSRPKGARRASADDHP